ncbi:CBL-interacting kinase 4-like protein [Labeo rohita]|uniref:CBL-interacting kinase 4-like protein n=1 Tax=Labeo rohita TaxID=84645 RepID=A0A498P7D0_LABRO|nr:CBL-interacting kinase 4-like protein [Labeo rohita]
MKTTIRTFPNQKPWVDKTIRDALRSRTAAYNAGLASGDMVPYKAASYNVRKAVKEAKQRYGRKLESQLQQNNSRSLWQGLRTITDYKAPTSGMMNADVTLAGELNTFYARFEAAAKDAKDANASGANGCRHEDTASTGNTRLRDFRLPSKVLRNFYSCTIESILTGNILTWFGNSTMQDRRALQRVVRSAERTIHTELPDLHSIYSRRCWTKARKIVKDLSHPNNELFSLMRSGKRFRSLKANTERLRRSFFPQAIRSLNQYITQY